MSWSLGALEADFAGTRGPPDREQDREMTGIMRTQNHCRARPACSGFLIRHGTAWGYVALRFRWANVWLHRVSAKRARAKNGQTGRAVDGQARAISLHSAYFSLIKFCTLAAQRYG